MEKTDILIIGAGVVGLAVARELSFENKNIVVAEKNKSFGQETSSRNSEVIHGGMYYPATSLKANLCIQGRRLLYQLCQDNGIAHRKVGKIIVACEKEEIPALEKIFEQGKINKVDGLRFMNKEQIEELEPKVSALAAIFSQETGIIDSHQLMEYFLFAAKDNGISVVYDAEITALRKNRDGYEAEIKNSGEVITVAARTVINCAGLESDAIAAMVGIDVAKEEYRLHYCKGQYFRVCTEKSKFINHLIYPVPKPKSGGLGIHATVDLAGSLRLGPDDNYLNNRIRDYSVDENKKNDFLCSVDKFLPFVEEKDLTADLSGIRPKLQPEGGAFRDFIIRQETDKGFPGFINLIGIESPGLTASPAIAKMVKALYG